MYLRDITFGQIKFLHVNKLTLSHYKTMEVLLSGEEVPVDKYYRDLEKLGIIFEGSVTEHGKKLVHDFIVAEDIDVSGKVKKVKRANEDFERWWAAFPSNPSHGDYLSTRSMRTKKDNCQTLFEDVIAEGKYTTDDLIRVLKLEVDLRIKESKRRNANQLEFMKGTQAYLNQREFETYFAYEQKLKQKATSKPKIMGVI